MDWMFHVDVERDDLPLDAPVLAIGRHMIADEGGMEGFAQTFAEVAFRLSEATAPRALAGGWRDGGGRTRGRGSGCCSLGGIRWKSTRRLERRRGSRIIAGLCLLLSGLRLSMLGRLSCRGTGGRRIYFSIDGRHRCLKILACYFHRIIPRQRWRRLHPRYLHRPESALSSHRPWPLRCLCC